LIKEILFLMLMKQRYGDAEGESWQNKVRFFFGGIQGGVGKRYKVFLTLVYEEMVLLVVTKKGPDHFIVKGTTLDGRSVSCSFDYRIVAKDGESVEVHQKPSKPSLLLKKPSYERRPPGRPEKPVLLVASVLGAIHKADTDFIFPPATALLPKYVVNVVHFASDGTFQPVGQSPRLSTTA
jgi:hypothetical protein